jgi:hypothetical protein
VIISPQALSVAPDSPRYVLMRKSEYAVLSRDPRKVLLLEDGARHDAESERWGLVRLDP